MDITVKLFAAFREITGLRETVVELPEGATALDLVQRLREAYPRLAEHGDSMLLAVNQEFADWGVRLRQDDEVALLPPVSGGVQACWIQSEPIDPSTLLARVRDKSAGAVVVFLGTVRADPGVAALDYEAYEPMAVKKMEALRAEAIERFRVSDVAIAHRTGRLALGEIAVAIACSAPHRQAAFDACEWAMDGLKQVVPIWKTERE